MFSPCCYAHVHYLENTTQWTEKMWFLFPKFIQNLMKRDKHIRSDGTDGLSSYQASLEKRLSFQTIM